ncbi:hypothetical protein KJ762_09470 [bacterium]|nr:hypothetical protein [bacterium]MBU1063975.1 hypothetical protein [bacterium]MBU1634722.1 hypothetical protein [bacterium]MBU1874428.1 hypothetical protein [bacterium]
MTPRDPTTLFKYNRAKRILKPLFIPFDHYVRYFGLKNRIKDGPNLILANHPGMGRDIAGVITAYQRQLYFLAAHYLFDPDILLNTHVKPALGPVFSKILLPVAVRFSQYLPKILKEQEMIPINKHYDGDLQKFAQQLRQSINQVKNYLLQGQAVVIFQITYNILKSIGQKRIVDKEPSRFHPYIPRFNPTFGKIAYELFTEHNLLVPVTPVGIHGAEGLNPFRKMVINIGKPLTIASCLQNQGSKDPVARFTTELERQVAGLISDSGLPVAQAGISIP